MKGTCVTVRTVLGSLAEGMTVAEILLDFPTLDENAVRAVESTHHDITESGEVDENHFRY